MACSFKRITRTPGVMTMDRVPTRWMVVVVCRRCLLILSPGIMAIAASTGATIFQRTWCISFPSTATG